MGAKELSDRDRTEFGHLGAMLAHYKADLKEGDGDSADVIQLQGDASAIARDLKKMEGMLAKAVEKRKSTGAPDADVAREMEKLQLFGQKLQAMQLTMLDCETNCESLTDDI